MWETRLNMIKKQERSQPERFHPPEETNVCLKILFKKKPILYRNQTTDL